MKQLFLFLFLSVTLLAIDINDDLHLRGFGTLNATLSSKENVELLPNGTQNILEKNQVNYNYSLLGAQLDWDMTDSLDIMLQGVYSKEDTNKAYEATLEWALIGYDFGNDYKLRLGKMKVPFMDGTESRYIKYSVIWVRPQILENGVNGFDSMYGANLIKSTYVEDIDLEFQLTVGQAENNLHGDKNKYLYNIAIKATYDNSWLRLSAGKIKFDQYDPRDNIITENANLTFISAETQISFKGTTFNGGYAFNRTETIPESDYIYGSISYEIKNVTPYLLYSYQKISNVPVLPAIGPPGTRPARNGYTISQHNAFGLRYDIFQDVAIKAEFDYFKIDINSLKENANIYRLSIDMVF